MCAWLHAIRVRLLLFGQIANAFPVNFPARAIVSNPAAHVFVYAVDPCAIGTSIVAARRLSSCAHDLHDRAVWTILLTTIVKR